MVEVVIDRGVNRGELLQGLDIPESRHRPFPPSKREMRVLSPVVQPAPERILKESKKARAAFRQTLPASVRKDAKEVNRRMMMARIEERQKHGKWDDEWVMHPLPTLNEPHKAMSWLTPDPDLDERRKAELFLRSGLARIDNVFQKTRRLFTALERPVGHLKRAQQGLARLRAVQPGDAGEVRDDIPGGE